MIEWLTQRPSPLLSKRLLDLLKGLHRSNRNSVLIEITHATTEKVIRALNLTFIAHPFIAVFKWNIFCPFQLLQSLTVSKLQDSVEPIFFYLLLGFQHSETVFHQVNSHRHTLYHLYSLQFNSTSISIYLENNNYI